MILRLTTVHENAGSAGILPAVAGHRALDDAAGRMPALPFPWQRGPGERPTARRGRVGQAGLTAARGRAVGRRFPLQAVGVGLALPSTDLAPQKRGLHHCEGTASRPPTKRES
jgi:hypothetical protein